MTTLLGYRVFFSLHTEGKKLGAKIRCPCVKCVNMLLKKQPVVYDHLVCHGMLRGYTIWGCHGKTASYIYIYIYIYISANKDSESQCSSRV
jgi:hypothetical protein